MDLKQLEKLGAFASAEVSPVSMVWAGPKGEPATIDFFVRELNTVDNGKIASASREDGGGGVVVMTIFLSVVNEDGSPYFESTEVIGRLSKRFSDSMFEAIIKHRKEGEEDAKK